MAGLNGKGPDGEGKESGRRLGLCSNLNDEERLALLGRGRGFRRKSGGGIGRAKRLKSGIEKIDNSLYMDL